MSEIQTVIKNLQSPDNRIRAEAEEYINTKKVSDPSIFIQELFEGMRMEEPNVSEGTQWREWDPIVISVRVVECVGFNAGIYIEFKTSMHPTQENVCGRLERGNL